MLSHLAPRGARPAAAPSRGGQEHPIRAVTRDVAAGETAWTAEVAQGVRQMFDGLAGEWHTRWRPDRLDGLVDAFERGSVDAGGICVELGSGTGMATPWLAERFGVVVAADLSAQMQARAPAGAGHRLRADASRLPLRDRSVDVAVLMNMILFPGETDRILARGGALVWVNTSGEDTPIHLPADQVHAAMPGAWSGVASRAGAATWVVLRRAEDPA